PDLHILFIAKSEMWRLSALAPILHARGVLIATESDGALDQGSAINFLVSDRRVKFEVSLDTAEKSGLKVSSRLLAVANRVVGAH
ncbi:MAG TPA: YfiR family protein, partial [Burkholderiales bacterium]|nr:YfiR family protein [Burkholderiales bacterium]